MSSYAWNLGISDVLNRIGSARILRDAGIVEVNLMLVFVVDHILEFLS